jgi:hypothetical protein
LIILEVKIGLDMGQSILLNLFSTKDQKCFGNLPNGFN